MGEQHREPLGPLRMAAGRVQPRERGMRQDVDSAATRVATPPSPSCSRKEDASAHVGDVSARGGRGAEASIVAIRRKSRKSSASAAKRPSASAASSEPYCASSSAAFFGPMPARAGQLVGRVAAQRDQVRHLLGVDAVALAHLGGADPRELAHAARRLEDRHAVARELERVAVGGRDEHVARPLPRRRGEEVVRLVAGRLRDEEAERADDLGQDLELLEDRVLEHASRTGRARTPRAGRSGTESVSQATRTASGCSACQSRDEHVREADDGVEADRLRQRVVRAMRERVAVDREQHAHSDASSSSMRAISRSVASCAARRRSPVARRSSISIGAP